MSAPTVSKSTVNRPLTKLEQKKLGKGHRSRTTREERIRQISVGQCENTKLYMFKQTVDPFDKHVHGHEYTIEKTTFMSHWTSFWVFFQVFYLLIVMLFLNISALVFVFEHINLSASSLHQQYVVDQIELYEGTTPPTERELFVLVWLFRAVLLAVIPSSIFIYRARLISLQVFTNIKMH